MDKRLRDCIRHMENLDYAALSQEDMERERKEFLIQMGFLQHELLFWQIWAGVFMICVFIGTGILLIKMTISSLLLCAAAVLLLIWTLDILFKRNRGIRQLYHYYDRLVRF
ncbi:MAG: hypothetical protein LKF52_00270 [Butyrivibrio sp.]|jgi:Flp pilus assembly protein TadB|nr:hypothetical protein [Butyrivibrio sp.]